MQNSSGQINKKIPSQTHTFFTSQFFQLNNDDSQMDFDISKQYLRSQLTDKSMVLRQMSEEHFIKALQTYYRIYLQTSFRQWRRMNQTQKRKQKLNPRTMTKIFLKMFYLLNKKIRSKLQKAILKIANFTKDNQMRTYQTPAMRGLKKLEESLQSLGSKYFYNYPTHYHHLLGQCFKQIRIHWKALSNQQILQNFTFVLQKMFQQIKMDKFNQKLKDLKRTKDKLDIFVGTLSLITNPIKRCFIHKFKQSQSKTISSNNLQDTNRILDQQCLQQAQQINQLLSQSDSCLGKGFDIALEKDVVKQEKVPSASTISECVQDKSYQDQKLVRGKQYQQMVQIISQKSLTKNQLKFSKQLKRKSSNQSKNKMKFKAIYSGNSPKKQLGNQNYIQKHLQNSSNHISKPEKQQISNLQIQKKLSTHLCKISLKQIAIKGKTLQMYITFEKSLNFSERSNRKITMYEKFQKLSPRRPDEPNFSVAQYSNLNTLPNSSIQTIRNQVINIENQQQSKRKCKVFKRIKSGKSLSNYQQCSSMTNIHDLQKGFPKAPVKFTYNEGESGSILEQINRAKDSRLKLVPSLAIQKRHQISVSISKSAKSENIINFKSIKRKKSTSNSSQSKFKNYYRFPISFRQNRQVLTFAKFDTNKRANQYQDQYQNQPYQHKLNLKNKMKQDFPRSSSLTFKTKRPVKSSRSVDKQTTVGIKNTQLKNKTNENQPTLKTKKSTQNKSEFVEVKTNLSNQYFNTQNMTLLSIRLGKKKPAGVSKSPHQNSGIKLVKKR